MRSNDVTAEVDGQGAPDLDFTLTLREFKAIAQRVHDRAGIVLGDSKRDLVYGRLGRRLRKLGCSSFSEYLQLLDGQDGADEQAVMINAITTNLTGFFREAHHFEALAKDTLPELARSPSQERRLRIWSAGCSSGEEPYSIAMTVQRALPTVDRWDARILATDIDTNMVAASAAGVYEAAKADPIPPDLRRRFVTSLDEDTVEMSDRLKRMISFKPLNLLQPWPMRGPFDVIFCRNVVIYFNKDTQKTLFDRFADMLTPNGWLFIGHSESLFRVSDRFRHLGRTIYRKVP
jgi:chemotaxis protein methyltransferase CheR